MNGDKISTAPSTRPRTEEVLISWGGREAFLLEHLGQPHKTLRFSLPLRRNPRADTLFERHSQAGQMAQGVEVLAAKSDNLSSVLRKERIDSQSCVLPPPHEHYSIHKLMHVHMCTRT